MENFKNFLQKLKKWKNLFSMDFFLKYNWVLTVFFFSLTLFFALFLWEKNISFLSSNLSTELIQGETNQDFEVKDKKIKKIMENLEERRDRFDNFPEESQPRERVFKSEFVWNEETDPSSENNSTDNKEDKNNSQGKERISF